MIERFSREDPCPVCGGSQFNLSGGLSVRCSGYYDNERKQNAFCTQRQEWFEQCEWLNGSQVPAPKKEGKPPRGEKIRIMWMKDIEQRAVQWLWDRYIPLGMLTILDGDGGTGKGTICMDLAARLSRGDRMPDGAPGLPPSASLILTTEDPAAEVLKPKLALCGADQSLVATHSYFSGQGETTQIGDLMLSDPSTLEELEWLIREHAFKLVYLDPLFGFSGDANTGNDAEMRSQILTPLAAIAERTQTAIVAIRHVTKTSRENASHHGGGSVAISNSARSVLYCDRDPENEGSFVMASAKMNLAQKPLSLRYEIVSHDPSQPAATIGWSGHSRLSANDLSGYKPKREKGAPAEYEEIAVWLQDRLKDGGEVAATQILSELESHYGRRPNDKTIRDARKEAGVVSQRSDKFERKWAWVLRDPESDELPCGDDPLCR